MIKIDCEQRSEAWYQYRLGRFTASRFATLMSDIKTKGYQDLIIEVAGEILTKVSEETYQNADMERGIELEPLAIKEYESIFGETEKVGFIITDESDELHEITGISPDAMKEPGMIEVKCPRLKTHLNYIKANRLPNEYKWQVQGQLLITDCEYCDFMSFYPGLKPFIIRVYPDLEMHSQLRQRLIESYKLVLDTIEMYENYNLW